MLALLAGVVTMNGASGPVVSKIEPPDKVFIHFVCKVITKQLLLTYKNKCVIL